MENKYASRLESDSISEIAEVVKELKIKSKEEGLTAYEEAMYSAALILLKSKMNEILSHNEKIVKVFSECADE